MMSAASRAPKPYGLCRFCLRDEVALTREHVFARWLVERLRAWRVTCTGHGPADAGAHTRIAHLVTNVCGTCNGGWMSELEVSFRQALFRQVAPRALGRADPSRPTSLVHQDGGVGR